MTRTPSVTRERLTLVAVAVAVILATVALVHQRDDARTDAGDFQERAETAEQYVARIDADCRGASGPGLARELVASGRCGAAEKIVEEGTADPLPVPQDGKDGTAGTAGKNGKNGRAGKDGTAGRKGDPGRGITSSVLNPEGELVLGYSDGTSVNVGRVIGREGLAGAPGTPGKDGETVDLTGYATEAWVTALIAALGCETTVGDGGVPLVLGCNITGKP